MINYEINRLVNFALQQGLLVVEDKIYAANLLLAELQLAEFTEETVEETLETPTPILEKILEYAVKKGFIENTTTERDLFDTRIMNCLMPRPSEVIAQFKKQYELSPVAATDFYYKFNIASNYIRKTRIDKNIAWKTKTEYGDLDITINLSKPEKDPRDIAKAKLVKSSSYPQCLLCKENEGFAGHINHPARQTHRIIPMQLQKKAWFLQYSPYTYYNEHCIILNSEHIPMKISRATFANLVDFLDLFPHYFAGSNADLPIVGGSILSHDHYQGGRYTFAMDKALVEQEYKIPGFEKVSVGRVKWPMSVLRLHSNDARQIVDLAVKILDLWRGYSDADAAILAESDGEKHNTITPIARKRDGAYEFDLVLRNNRTSKEHPMGIFHPHAEVHHIKKENIGLIEVLGLAILPARLKEELELLRMELLKGTSDVSNIESIKKHADWYQDLRLKYHQFTETTIDDILKTEIGLKFMQVLTHAGVFKRDNHGIKAFDAFVQIVKK
ncbi:UDPglucose--hexose-1-phosphate uridylyltransferase [Propionispira arboris]|uniref:Galactose-1-phosphate uridylyltransferase n=1 Tax=Propionispira arboris TaxID=84035 RepID=A0A1H7DD13_9FIRM|nr:UDP-glucose--hexose-1-phosphate uridylyltransferase [Propionispira arboris]SEJ96125.1 UDPglucose--hexose-1-phosphate uridylyltransferase [Propionispira arboris]